MGTSNPRPRGAPSVSGELQKARSDREQIRRMISRTPKAVAATGIVSGFTRATSGLQRSQPNALDFGQWMFDAGWNYTPDNTDSAPDLTAQESSTAGVGQFGPVKAGFYMLRGHVFVDGLVASTVGVTWNYAPDGQGGAVQVDHTLSPSPSGTNAWIDTLTVGPVYLPAASERKPLGCQLFWTGGSTATGTMECWIDVYKVG